MAKDKVMAPEEEALIDSDNDDRFNGGPDEANAFIKAFQATAPATDEDRQLVLVTLMSMKEEAGDTPDEEQQNVLDRMSAVLSDGDEPEIKELARLIRAHQDDND